MCREDPYSTAPHRISCGRPILYRTTPNFLRTFGISTLEELPPIEKVSFGEPEIVEEMEQQTIEEPAQEEV